MSTVDRQALIRLRPGGGGNVVINGGADLADSVVSLTVHGSHDEVPQLQLNLLMDLIELNGQMRVEIPDATREALIELGWTPPAAVAGVKQVEDGDGEA